MQRAMTTMTKGRQGKWSSERAPPRRERSMCRRRSAVLRQADRCQKPRRRSRLLPGRVRRKTCRYALRSYVAFRCAHQDANALFARGDFHARVPTIEHEAVGAEASKSGSPATPKVRRQLPRYATSMLSWMNQSNSSVVQVNAGVSALPRARIVIDKL